MTPLHMWNHTQRPAFRIAILLIVLLAGLVSGGEARRARKPRPVNVPTAELDPSDWRFTFQHPPQDWTKPDFDDSKWSQGKSGFGTNCPNSRTNTEWSTSDIWLRRAFNLEAPISKGIQLRLHHDEDAEVYLNGVLAMKVGGHVGEYQNHEIPPAALAALKPGRNVMSVHCHQTGGGQYVDAGLTEGRAFTPQQIYAKKDSWAETFCAIRETMTEGGIDTDNAQRQVWASFEVDYPMECDWMQQDAGVNAWRLFSVPEGGEVLKAAMPKVLDELGAAGQTLRRSWDALSPNSPSIDLRKGLELYLKACEARRVARLKPLVAASPRFVFTKHYTMGGSHYAYTEGQSDAQAERHFVPGSALCLAEVSTSGQVKVDTLIDDPKGVIRDPDVSHDGKRILFSWKKSDREDDYHLYEMEVSTRKIRQVTSGLGWADYEGAYLPDGDIVFNSTRPVQIVDCWWTEVSNIYRCDRDGKYLRRLTFDQVHDNFPTVTDDGRVLYTRWEYNDRGQLFPQPLLQMSMDGTNQSEFYGGNSWFPTTILQARAIPGTQKVIAIATGHHSRQTGKVIIVDPSKGRQENQGVTLIAPVQETKAERIDSYGQNGELFMYPYPISETEFLISYHPMGWKWRESTEHLPRKLPRGENVDPRLSLYFMTADGRREMLASDSERPCNQPIPLRARPTGGARPSTVDYTKKEGSCYVQDVYAGPGLEGVKRGTVKTLRVIALEYRVAGIGNNGNGGPGGGAMVSTPVAVGNGTWDVKAILGDAPVKQDGSVFFKAPARVPFYFQLLDEKGRMVQSMRSWTTLQPAENASCVGCHEDKNSAPRLSGGPTMAMRAGPDTLKPFYGPTRGFSFIKEVQPILDAKCVSCHNGEKDKPFSLKATEVVDPGAKRKWSEAYLNLTHARPDHKEKNSAWRGNAEHPMVNWISAQSVPPMLKPYSNGANKSKMIEILEQKHGKVELTKEEMDKIAAWIDLAVPFCGDYVEANAWNQGEMDKHKRYDAKRRMLEEMEQKSIEEFFRLSATRGR